MDRGARVGGLHCAPMAGNGEPTVGGGAGRFPRCGGCGREVRTTGWRRWGALCADCLCGALPFVGIPREGDYRRALREHREGPTLGAANLEGRRFDPFDDDVRAILGAIDTTLRGCEYTGYGDLTGRQREIATRGGCSLAVAFHNVRSARGRNMEMLEAGLRRWNVRWDVVGLAETWLDKESEAGLRVEGYGAVCASRKERSGEGWRYW